MGLRGFLSCDYEGAKIKLRTSVANVAVIWYVLDALIHCGFSIFDFFSSLEPSFFSMVDEKTRNWQNGWNTNFDTQYVKMQQQDHTSYTQRVVYRQPTCWSRTFVSLHTDYIALAFPSQTAHFQYLCTTAHAKYRHQLRSCATLLQLIATRLSRCPLRIGLMRNTRA